VTGSTLGPLVTVSVRNTAARPSREVVQVYFAPTDVEQPIRLVGWAAAEVSTGEAIDVTVQCDARMWRRWDIRLGCWVEIDGGGELLIARGLGDVRLRLPAPATVPALTTAGTVSR